MSVAASYNGNTLSTFAGTDGILVQEFDDASTPDITLNLLPLAKAARSSVTSELKQQKTVTVTGKIIGTSIADCTNLINTFKGYLIGKEQILNINDGTINRNYICTVNKNVIQRPGYLFSANFTTSFLCSQPYGTDNSSTTLLNGTARTLTSYTDAITVGGNSEWQTPVITITVTAVTGGTGKFITVGNNLTGQACTITRNWSNGDVLVIDTSSITAPVTVNGTQVVFTGALPTFNPSAYVGSQAITYNDNFTTRTMTENVINYQRWE